MSYQYRQVTKEQAKTLHALGFKVYYKGSYGYREYNLIDDFHWAWEWDLKLFVRVE